MIREEKRVCAGQIPVAAFQPRSSVNGPGVRSVLWVQGCPFRCDGCFNPEFLAFRKDRDVDREIVEKWVSDAEGTEGVTFSGGEPFYHAPVLVPLAERIKSYNKSVVIFTGYTEKDLLASTDRFQKKLMEGADLIISGIYEKNNPGSHPLLSSGNQKLLFPSNKYRKWQWEKGGKRIEFRVLPSGAVEQSGLQGVLMEDKNL